MINIQKLGVKKEKNPDTPMYRNPLFILYFQMQIYGIISLKPNKMDVFFI